jgi:serine-type D-Ala-D-Ala carboxypeptidase/endopeptidase (penicillin-binding protein 4)
MNKLFAMLMTTLLMPVSLAQNWDISRFMPDSVFGPASISLTIADLKTGVALISHDPNRALTPASVQKLISSSAALELLGAAYRFHTVTGYTGVVDRKGSILTGDIIIRGGGDPSLGSEYFPEYDMNVVSSIVSAIEAAGIKKIKGRVIADDRIYDYNPVPAEWSWGDLGNYYGAGAYGITLFDNTHKIYFQTGLRGTVPQILRIEPEMKDFQVKSYLISEGTTDRGYVYSAPYGSYGWISGFIPENRQEFVLKASIPDPPLMLAKMVTDELEARDIEVTDEPATARTISISTASEMTPLHDISSPPLSEIVHILNHESVNLYAEHLVKQMGYEINGRGTTDSGVDAIRDFLNSRGIANRGIFIEDGSGLSPGNGISSGFIVDLIRYMLTQSENSEVFRNSLPPAGEAGTMKSYFRDPIFRNNLRAKTGTLTRVRSYAGVFTGASGREYVFCIFINNYIGPLSPVNRHIEEMFKQFLINN